MDKKNWLILFGLILIFCISTGIYINDKIVEHNNDEGRLPPGYRLICSSPSGKFRVWIPFKDLKDGGKRFASIFDSKAEAIDFAVLFEWSRPEEDKYEWLECGGK